MTGEERTEAAEGAAVPVGPRGHVPLSAGVCGVRNGKPLCAQPATLAVWIDGCVSCAYADHDDCQGHPICEPHGAAMRSAELPWRHYAPNEQRPVIARMSSLVAS